MSLLFNYKEFIELTNKGKIVCEKLVLPKNTLIADSPEHPKDFVYLIGEGFVMTSLVQAPSRAYTICGKGAFLNYYSLMDSEKHLFSFKTISNCVIYKYAMKDLEYILAMFPENYGFQFFIMKDLATHLYYKTLLNSDTKSGKVSIAFRNMAKLHGIPLKGNQVLIPRQIQTQIILSYSGLSKSTGYEQLALLKQSGEISKVNKQWLIHDQALHDFCQQRINAE